MTFQHPRFAKNDRLATASKERPLAKGEKGRAVEILQQCLAELGIPMPISAQRSGLMDGIFGAETEAAVKRFQKQQGLTADGMVGPLTLAKLDAIFSEREKLERLKLVSEVADQSPNSRWHIT